MHSISHIYGEYERNTGNRLITNLLKMLLSTINHKEKSTSKFSPITLPFAIPVTRKHWMPPVYSIVSIKANIPVKAPAAWACLLPNRSANYISFTSDIIIQESIVSRSIFSISRNKIHFFPDFKIFQFWVLLLNCKT